MEWHKAEFTISDNNETLNRAWIVSSLQQTYWASHRSTEVILHSLDNSLCFGLYRGEEQVGFARVVTDEYTFAWICDVFVDAACRGKGLGVWLVQTVLEYPIVERVGLKILRTRDAHGLYEKFGFRLDEGGVMIKRGP